VGGLVYIRVKEGGAIDAAKPVLEGLNPQETSQLLSLCQAEEVRPWSSVPSPPESSLSLPSLQLQGLSGCCCTL